MTDMHNRLPVNGLDDMAQLGDSANYLPLREVVIRTVRAAILDGSLRPGQMISENKIAAKLSVSRTPVREAIRVLQTEDLISILPGRKVIVSVPTIEDIEDIYEIRLILESEALRRITPEYGDLIQELEDCLDRAAGYLKRGQITELRKTNADFHPTIMSVLDNKTLRQFTESLYKKSERLRFYSLVDEERARRSEEEHRRIFDCVKRGNNQGAILALSEHLTNSRDILIKVFLPW